MMCIVSVTVSLREHVFAHGKNSHVASFTTVLKMCLQVVRQMLVCQA